MPAADLLLTGAHVLNVFSGELERLDVAIAGGRIVGFGDIEARERLDLSGRVLLPGFCEGHIHLESTMLAPGEFARAVAAHGTTIVVADPHEIANVAGLHGVRFLMQGVPPELLDLLLMAPSCVPATPFETAGAEIEVAEIEEMLARCGRSAGPSVLGLGEVMNFPGVIGGDPAVLAKLAAAHGKPIDGHAPGVTGRDLMAYIAAGPSSDHEATTLAEGEEKLRLGMWLMIREGSASRNLDALAPLLCGPMRHRCLLVSDDLEPGDLLERGHLDDLLRRAVARGVAPVDAVRAVTINVAQRFGLERVGAIAPGYAADVVVVGDLEHFTVELVLKRGQPLPAAVPSTPAPPASVADSMRLTMPTAEQLAVRASGPDATVRVIVAQEGLIVTGADTARLPVREGRVQPDPAQDVLKLAVLERHGRNGAVGLGFVRGFGLRAGALATTVAHDSHNLLVAGADDASVLTAIAALRRLGGGQVVACGEQVLAELPLPLGGLMSDRPIAEVAQQSRALQAAAASLGCGLSQPFMTLSFLALPVIPHLKLTDQGLFDVDQFRFAELLV